jgi:hypothetical protein
VTGCARVADPQHSVIAVKARTRASRCTVASPFAIPDILDRFPFCWNENPPSSLRSTCKARPARIYRKTLHLQCTCSAVGPSKADHVRADILYELASGPGTMPIEVFHFGERWRCWSWRGQKMKRSFAQAELANPRLRARAQGAVPFNSKGEVVVVLKSYRHTAPHGTGSITGGSPAVNSNRWPHHSE